MNALHYEVFRRGVFAWNDWRHRVPTGRPDLCGINASDRNLVAIDLSNTDLRQARFERCPLHRASFKNSDCADASFRDAIMHSADLRGADLSRADFTNVHFADSNGNSRAIVDGATFIGAKFTTKQESLPDGSFLDLAMCDGLAEARFDHETFITSYLQQAFQFAIVPPPSELSSYPLLIEGALGRIGSFVRLMEAQAPPSQLVEVCDTITAELMLFMQRHPGDLGRVAPRQFEYLVAELLASFGWDVQITPESKDGGYDIFAISKDISGVTSAWIVECKRYKPELRVGIEIARSLYAIKGELKVSNAMLATTSHFTRGVEQFAASRYDFSIKDFESIVEWLNLYRPNPRGGLYIKNKRLIIP